MRSLNLGVPISAYPLIQEDFSGKLLILGSGRTVWVDYASAAVGKFDVMCVNDPVMHFPGFIRHFYSNDVKRSKSMLLARRPEYIKEHGHVPFTHSCKSGLMFKWPWPGHGTSSLNAVYTGLALGYEQIVLCGIPLDDEGHYFDPPWTRSNFIREVGFKGNGKVKYWSHARDEIFQGRVTSMSGRTKELLG